MKIGLELNLFKLKTSACHFHAVKVKYDVQGLNAFEETNRMEKFL